MEEGRMEIRKEGWDEGRKNQGRQKKKKVKGDNKN